MKKLGIISSTMAALGALGLGHLYFQRLEAEVSGGTKVPVLVAAEDVPVGAALTEKRLAVRDIPQAYVEGRHVRATEVKKVLGSRLVGGLRANEALLWSDLAKFNDHARVLSGLVQQGMRAVAIDSRSADFEGLLRPGDRVDVLFTAEGKEDGSTATVIQNVLVLSVGTSTVRVEDEGTGRKTVSRGGSVTVSVTVEQAQLLTQAEKRGRLTLTLRNSDDITIVEGVPETTARDLRTEAPRADAKPRDPRAPKDAIEHVR